MLRLQNFNGTITINNGPGTDVYNSGSFSINSANSNLTVTTGATIDGPVLPSNYVSFGGATLTNNGTIFNLLIFRGTIAGTGSIGSIITFNTNPVDNGELTLTGNQIITTLLNFNYGNIVTGPNKLIVASTASVQNNSGTQWYVNGNLQMNFPAGNNTKNYRIGDATGYRPVSLTLSDVSGTGGVIASTTNGDHPNIGSSQILAAKSVNRFWTFTNTGLTFSNASPVLNWDISEVDPGVDSSNLKAGKFNTPNWSYPSVSNISSTSIQVNGVTSFSDLAIGELSGIVNIPDANFKAALVGNHIY